MKKIFYVGAWLVSAFLMVNLAIADLTGDPIFKPFGSTTTLKDSTNYVTVNKSMYVLDSFKISKDLYVGVKGGVIYLDTNRSAKIEYSGNTFKMTTSKSSGGFYFDNGTTSTNSGVSFVLSEGTPSFTIYKYRNGQLTTALTYDTLNGLDVKKGDIFLSSSSNQIKIPSDTASDYDGNDAVTINRQSGVITTKSLTTATDNFYTFTLTNSLISATSKVFLSYCGGTESAGRPMVYRVVSGSGSATCIILNLAGAGSFNGNIKFNFVVFN